MKDCDKYLWQLRERIAHRRELSRRWGFYGLAAKALTKLLIKRIKEKHHAA